MAIEYHWPKRVVLRRIHDRVLKWLESDPSIVTSYHPYTPLHLPDCVFIDTDTAFCSLLESIFSNGLGCYVYADSINSVRVAIRKH